MTAPAETKPIAPTGALDSDERLHHVDEPHGAAQSGSIRHAGPVDRRARDHGPHPSDLLRFRPRIAGDGGAAARSRRGRASRGRHCRRHRSLHRLHDRGRQRSGRPLDGACVVRTVPASGRCGSSGGRRDGRRERPHRRLLPRSRCRGHAHERLHLGRRRAPNPRKARRRRAA